MDKNEISELSIIVIFFFNKPDKFSIQTYLYLLADLYYQSYTT